MKMHLNLATRDLDASVAFYRALLPAEPAKHYPDYALFLTDEPGLELALDLDPAVQVREGAHYGVAVEHTQERRRCDRASAASRLSGRYRDRRNVLLRGTN